MLKQVVRRLNQVRYSGIIWVIAISETLHNIEEAIWLPAWSQKVGYWHPPVTAFGFRFTAVIITIVFYGIIYYFSKYKNTLSKYLYVGSLSLILLNVFLPHLFASIIVGGYAPGLATGLILNFPTTTYLLRRGLEERQFSVKDTIIGSIILAFIIIPLILLLFSMGDFLESI